MEVTYIYHSGFLITTSRAYVVIDFWRDTPDGLVQRIVSQTDKPVYFLASHVHHDHFNPEIIFFGPHIRYILSADIRRRNKPLRDDERIVWLHRGENFKDDNIEVHAHGSTDVGVSFLLMADGEKIFHAGDFNDWQRSDASPEDNHRMRQYYASELQKMVPDVSGCNVAMLPIDPRLGPHTIDGARLFCQTVHPKHVLPMHSWEMYDEAEAWMKRLAKT